MEEIWLPDFLLSRPLGGAALWECLAARLPWSAGRAEFLIEFGGIWKEEPSRTVALRWREETAAPYSWGVAEQTITELAACALRATEKTQQLLKNAFGWSGYVIVVGFHSRRVLLSAHNFGEQA